MALTADERAELARLKKRHEEMISGNVVTKIAYGQRTIEKAKGDAGAVKARIDELERNARSGRGAIGFRF